jgi:3-oxoacyl-[acyl-carrier-protein] synthase-1
MQQALANAGLAPGDIAAVKVHGTASLSNDESESAGLQQLFAPLPPLAALKPFIGHTLGACGLNELVLFCAALEAGFLVATPGISAVPGELGVQLNQQREANHGRFFMLNYFGFGGNNSSLIIERHSGVSA